MKGTCINAGDVSTFNFLGELPVPGRSYILEDASSGTKAQNDSFHTLIRHWWDWMYRTGGLEFEWMGVHYNFETPSWMDFRELWKARYGAGAISYGYVDDLNGRGQCKTKEEIPMYAVADFNAGNHGRVWSVLKSWGDYTKPERSKTIQAMIDMIPCSGCDDRKVWEIIEGMQEMGFKKSI